MERDRFLFRAALAMGCGWLSLWTPDAHGQFGMQGPAGMQGPGGGRPPGANIAPRPQNREAPVKIEVDDASQEADLHALIVARVGDEVILLSEVLEPIQHVLEKEKERRTPAEYRQLEWETLKQVTQARIEKTVILNELKLRVPDPAVLDLVRQQANEDFEKYLQSLVRKNGFKNREELLQQLEEEGASLSKLRSEFVDNTLAQQFVNQLVRSQVKEPTRAEILRYYKENGSEFAEDPGAIWSHIQVDYGSDKKAAQAKAVEAHKRLKTGGDFAEIARKFSDGPTAVDGGAWSLTSQGSYAETAVDHAIFNLPVGQISEIIPGSTAFHIVRVDKRSDGSPPPFKDVQARIRDILKNQGLGELRKAKIQEIMQRHYVESIFDETTDLTQANERLQSRR